MLIDRITSAVETGVLVADGERLCALDYADSAERMLTRWRPCYGNRHLQEASDPEGLSGLTRVFYRQTMPLSTISRSRLERRLFGSKAGRHYVQFLWAQS